MPRKGFTLLHLVGTIVLVNLILAWMFSAIGCSATQSIASTATAIQTQVTEAANEIVDEATQSKAELESIRTEENSPTVDSINERQDRIINKADEAKESVSDAVARIHKDVTKVQDRVPWWATLLGWLTGTVGAVALLILLWKTGVLAFIGRIVGLGTALIPRSIKADAKFDAEAIVEGTATARQRENIARKRADSRVYESAFLEYKNGH